MRSLGLLTRPRLSRRAGFAGIISASAAAVRDALSSERCRCTVAGDRSWGCSSPVAVVELQNGTFHYLYEGQLIPLNASRAHVEHLLEVGLIEEVKK